MSKGYLAMKQHDGKIAFPGGINGRVKLPEGAIGMLFIFKTKTAARKFWGRDVPLLELEESKK